MTCVHNRIQILAQVERLATSRVLRESESLRKLLAYLSHHALDNPGETIKEYQIATEVFGRSPDFDPQLNSMVRVQAGRLRTKITEYYSDEGSDDPIVVDFPKGTYTLNFREKKPGATSSTNSADESNRLSRATGRSSAQGRWKALAIALLVAVIGCLSLLVYVVARKESGYLPGRTESVPSRLIFWRGFLTGPEEPWVIFSNAEFVGRPETGMRYFDAASDSKETVTDHYTGVGEVLGIHSLDLVFALLHQNLRVKRGKLFSLDDAQKNDLIIVGSTSENLTLREFRIQSSLCFEKWPTEPGRGTWE